MPLSMVTVSAHPVVQLKVPVSPGRPLLGKAENDILGAAGTNIRLDAIMLRAVAVMV